MRMERYNRKLEESFLKPQILKAIRLTNRVLQKRTGKRIYTGELPIDFKNKEGRFSGLICLMPNKRMMRYNWKMMDHSSTIVSVDFWIRRQDLQKPDLHLDLDGMNIVQIIDVLVSVIKRNIKPQYNIFTEKVSQPFITLFEDFTAKNQGKSAKITATIKQWAIDKDINNDDLANTRIKYLWQDFTYWFNEIANPELEGMSEITFRSYLLDFMEKQGIKNIYMRSLTLRKGNREKIIVTDTSSEAAYKDVEHLKMNISDLRDFMGNALMSLVRGYQNSLIISGKAGIGKTTLTNNLLKSEGMKVFNMNGSIRNLKILYNLLSQHNTPKDVIVFDDVPDMFSKSFAGQLSAALDDKPERIISFPSEIGKDMKDAKKWSPELKFKGKVVILTNVAKASIPKYLTSRAITIEVNASTEEMADDIRKNLENVLPQVEMKDKTAVLDFIEQLGNKIKTIDYRSYKIAVMFYLTGSPDWKKHIFALLK